MSNALTDITDINLGYISKQENSIINIQKKYNKNGSMQSGTFSKIFDKKIDKNGEVNINKLSKKEKKLYDSCIEMESLLWKIVLNSMKKTINKYRLIDGGQAEEIFTDFLYDEYSMLLAKNSETGLSKEMFKQLSTYI